MFERLRSAAFALAVAAAPLAWPAAAAVDIREVVSPGGITAWLVEDYSVPIVSIRFAFEGGGSVQDPQGREGLADLITTLFDEGAGDLASEAFQERLDRAGAEMRFFAGRDNIGGSMRMLAETRDEALELLRLAVTEPRFDAPATERMRAQLLSGLLAQAREPETDAQRRWAKALYGEHPYARPGEGTPETLAAITPDDLRAFHRRVFARANLRVGVVGAIDAATLAAELDRLFGALPEKPSLTPVGPAAPAFGQRVEVLYDLPQTTLQLAYPGLDRSDPQFFAAYLMNHILGGGDFTSRLFGEVREKRGLAYSVGSSLVTRRHSSMLVIGTSTRADRAAETLAVIRGTVKRMAEQGPTEAELSAAKTYVIGSYAINNLDSSGAIASTLVELQVEGLGIDYMQRRAELIERVTLDEVKAAAKRLLGTEPAVLTIGPAQGEGAPG